MNISYQINIIPPTKAIAELYNSSGLNRPTADLERMAKMYAHSNLVISAWNGLQLVGIARSLTDFCYSCYLADLAVREEYKSLGIGKKLIALTKEQIGEQTMLLLLSAPAAMAYYPKVGFEQADNAFLIKRKK